jgi:hypothetical protein
MLNETALDLDGVIFDCEKTFQNEALKLNLKISIKRPEIYNMVGRYEISKEQVSLINSKIDFSNMDIFEEVLNLKHYINNIRCFITSSPVDLLPLRKANLYRILDKDIPVYYAEPGKKHIVIKDLGIKYFIDDHNVVIYHINLNCPTCKAYWLDRGYKDEILPKPINKINSLTEFFKLKSGLFL